MPKKIFIGGLSATATEASLQEMFAPFGSVLSVELLSEPPAPTAGSEVQGYGQMPGGTVTFADEAAGERAIEELNGAAVDGGTLTVAPWPA